MSFLPALLIGRLIRFLVRLVRPGGGSALPGLIVSKFAPSLVYKTLNSFKQGLVVITGTAGKSTTTKMAVAIVRAHGVDVFTNPSTANIEQGFFSTIVKTGDLFGRVPGDIAILEMDEGHAAALVQKVKPRFSVILNVFDDQIDRFVDPALVRDKLKVVAEQTKEMVLLNTDDQNCRIIGQELSATSWFGINSKVGQIDYAKTYLPELPRPKAELEVVEFVDRSVRLQAESSVLKFELPARGLHFALDAVAAVATAKAILGSKFDETLTSKVLDQLPPVFSRGEIREVNGEPVEFILVQNPISMQLNLDNLQGSPEQVFFAIGRDVHDPSWMWTVYINNLKSVSMVGGFNYADAALLLEYHDIPVDAVEREYFKAIDTFFSLPKPTKGIKTVIYSADAMRRLRRYKGFTDPEDVQRV